MRPKLFFIFLLIAFNASSQDKIDTDRPDQTESVNTVPKKYFQGEFGFGKENYLERDYRTIHPTFLLKYGLLKKLELRLEGEYATEYRHLIPNGKTSTSNSIEIGAKVALFEEKGLLPKTSLIVHLGLPFLTGPTPDHLFPSFRFTFQNSITENIAIGYNLGAEWDGFEKKPEWIYTIAPGFNIGENWYAYVEAFGGLQEGNWQHALDGGIAYYLSNNSKLDLSGGFGLGDNPLRNYFAIGFSFRIPTAKK